MDFARPLVLGAVLCATGGTLAGCMQPKAAHVSRSSQAAARPSVKFIAGTPVNNYDQAFEPELRDHLLKTGQISENEQRWILTFKEGVSDAEIARICDSAPTCVVAGSASRHPYAVIVSTEEEMHKVVEESNNNIKFVEPDMIMKATYHAQEDTPVTSWGLSRIRARQMADVSASDPGSAGDGVGVNVYILDTGLRSTHKDFGGRAMPGGETWAYMKKSGFGKCHPTMGAGCALDKNGHGTHCAGTAAGTTYGVAKGANVHGYKVLGDNGSGSYAGIIMAIESLMMWREGASVGSMSLGGGKTEALNAALDALVASGVAVSVAAGNENTDACTKSPASAALAITVGSTDSLDARSYFSNYGPCVDIWAPGSQITSTWMTGDEATNTISGTSMACPHVTGVVAVVLGRNQASTPTEVEDFIKSTSTMEVISDIRNTLDGLVFLSTNASKPNGTDSSEQILL